MPGRSTGTRGGRPIVVGVRLTAAEAAELDRLRGVMDRGTYLRWLIIKARAASKP